MPRIRTIQPDFDAPRYMIGWLVELESEGCIERYEVGGIDYLRVAHWHKHQRVYHPTRSYLPASPHERLSDSGIRESTGRLCGRDRNGAPDQDLGARSGTFPENSRKNVEDDAPVVVTQQSVLRALQRIQKNAEDDNSHPSALRSVELQARIGLPGAKSGAGEERSLSPAEILGVIPIGASRD